MNSPRKAVVSLSILLFASLAMIGCAGFKNGAPPTKAEQSLFTVTTNFVPSVSPSGETNFQPIYSYSPGPVIKGVQNGVGIIPGYGGLAGTAIGALAALWAWIRSSKAGATAATLAQSIETFREFIKGLPNGPNMDLVLTNWLQQHQADTNTVNSVLQLLANDVSNPDAKIAAEQIQATLTSLTGGSTPPPAK